jgi:hypothetical protein
MTLIELGTARTGDRTAFESDVPKPLEKANEMAADSKLTLERRIDGQLWATRGGASSAVKVRRCFPWSEPGRFISLRDADDDEFAVVEDALELDADSLSALEQGLAEAGFVIEIVAIRRLLEEVEIYVWEVDTRQGSRRFQTKRDDWPRSMPGGGLLIRDVAGDLFFVADPAALDERSRELLWVFMD